MILPDCQGKSGQSAQIISVLAMARKPMKRNLLRIVCKNVVLYVWLDHKDVRYATNSFFSSGVWETANY